MGNRLSHPSSGGRDAHHHLNISGIAPEPYDHNMPRLRGGDAKTSNRGYRPHWDSPPASATGAEYDCQTLPYNEGADAEFCEIPAAAFNAARESHRRPREDSPGTVRATPAETHFDFNDSNHPNPWHRAEPEQERECMRDAYSRRPLREHDRHDDIPVRQFARCRDEELFEYLASRAISTGFLAEIDQFLRGHPEIASCAEGRNTLVQLNTLPPLQAYKYFLKGYTRPARYIDGIVRTDGFVMPIDYPYRPLRTKRDPELLEFFDGFDYRHDIIDRIDVEVYKGMRELAYGCPISLPLRKLICYAVWGNPVDAYKWFEYSYQDEYMPHRYLPEHVVLGHIPKPANAAKPRPQILTGLRKHGDVRARMARANDQGVDVLDVLIAEYRMALVRRCHRRAEIDELVAKAKKRLEIEQNDPTGVDIVDLIMDDAVTRQSTNHRNYPRNAHPRAQHIFHYRTTTNRLIRGYHVHNTVRRALGFLQVQAADLHQAKATLLRLYNQESNAYGPNMCYSNLQMIRKSRASAERRYVNCLVRYLRDANRMTPSQASGLQRNFTRARMSDLGVSNRNYLLGMYPLELR